MQLQDFRYREKFKLTYAEFMAEPYDVYQINLEIMNSLAQRERLEASKVK